MRDTRRDVVLEVRNLRVEFGDPARPLRAVDGISFELRKGRTLGVVGESGSGKTVMGLAILGLLPARNARVSGEVRVDGVDVLTASSRSRRRLRGRKLGMVFQDALSALHPYFTVGHQIAEAYRVQTGTSRRVAARRSIEMLERVGIADARRRANAYPHELSGGMRQRSMIAMALISNPAVLIADEPTTALDATVQTQILNLINDLRSEMDTAVIFITHDLSVIADVADDVLVMYAGRAVERGSADDVFYAAEHPYTWGLLASTPRLDRPRSPRLSSIGGSPPSPFNVPTGCAFHPRCPYATRVGPRCAASIPELRVTHAAAAVACHLPHDERVAVFATILRRL
jgi:peptide/nickel transport system ATP-binding protein